MKKQIMSISGAGALALGAIVGLAEATPIQWASVDGGNDHWYDVINTGSKITWEQARDEAQSNGWHLVTITSVEEDDFVASVLNNQKTTSEIDYWLGGYQPAGSSEPAGGWSWVTGEPWTYADWYPGEPNDLGGQDYLHYWPSGPWRWDDVGNISTMVGYVVETIPEPATFGLLGLAGAAVLLVRRNFRG